MVKKEVIYLVNLVIVFMIPTIRMLLKKYVFILINLISISLLSQDFEWEGYGKGLSYLKISNGEVRFNSYHWSDVEGGKIVEVNDQWIIFERLNHFGDSSYNGRIQILNNNFDSLRIHSFETPVTYYKPEHIAYLGRYKFQEFKLEYIYDYSSLEYKIEFNRYGRFRFSDRENKTLFEINLSETHINKFISLIEFIDIRNMNESKGWMNICLDDEFIFTFIDGHQEELKYRAIQVPIQLISVKNFLEEVLRSNGYKIEQPYRD